MLLALSKPLLLEKQNTYSNEGKKILTKLLIIFKPDFSFSHNF